MNFLKRAGKSLLFYKKNTLELFCVFLILGVIIQSGLCILSASQQSVKQVRSTIGATVLVKNDNVTTGDIYYGKDLITIESMNKIAQLPDVVSYNPLGYSMGKGTNIFESYKEEAQTAKYPNSNEFRVQGCSDASLLTEFTSGDFELIKGRNIEAKDKNIAIISSEVATQNEVTVDDTITLNPYYGGEAVTLTIIGIYKAVIPLPHTDVPFYNSENLIITDVDSLIQLNKLNSVYTVSYKISDPTKAKDFIHKVQTLELAEGDQLSFLINDSEYRSMAGTINSMIRISLAMVVVSMLMGAIIVSLLVMILFKDRNYEIGILLSMGESKAKVVTQMIIEVLVPILLAATGAVCISTITAYRITAFFGGSDKIVVTVQPFPVFAMYLCGILLTIIASTTVIWRIIRYQPKQMLMEMQ
jgi:putative ABC transport system permease protein